MRPLYQDLGIGNMTFGRIRFWIRPTLTDAVGCAPQPAIPVLRR